MIEKMFTSFTPETLWAWFGGLIIIVFSLKTGLEIWDWFKERIQKNFEAESEREHESDQLIQKLEEINQVTIKNSIDNKESFERLTNEILDLNRRVSLLTDSDKESIKQFIIDQHTKCMAEGWVDPRAYEIVMNKFHYYREEGGNSYVHELIDDMKRLPKTPPRTIVELNEFDDKH